MIVSVCVSVLDTQWTISCCKKIHDLLNVLYHTHILVNIYIYILTNNIAACTYPWALYQPIIYIYVYIYIYIYMGPELGHPSGLMVLGPSTSATYAFGQVYVTITNFAQPTRRHSEWSIRSHEISPHSACSIDFWDLTSILSQVKCNIAGHWDVVCEGKVCGFFLVLATWRLGMLC